MKRIIKPHKGGRTERMEMVLTPSEKQLILRHKGNKSLPDFILSLIKKIGKKA